MFLPAKPWKSWVGNIFVQHLLSGRTLQAFRIKRRGALDPARSVKRNAIERDALTPTLPPFTGEVDRAKRETKGARTLAPPQSLASLATAPPQAVEQLGKSALAAGPLKPRRSRTELDQPARRRRSKSRGLRSKYLLKSPLAKNNRGDVRAVLATLSHTKRISALGPASPPSASRKRGTVMRTVGRAKRQCDIRRLVIELAICWKAAMRSEPVAALKKCEESVAQLLSSEIAFWSPCKSKPTV